MNQTWKINVPQISENIDILRAAFFQFTCEKPVFITFRLHFSVQKLTLGTEFIVLTKTKFRRPILKWKTKQITCHCVKSAQIRSFFWSVFFRIRDLQSKSSHSVPIWGNKDLKYSVFVHFSRSVSNCRNCQNVTLSKLSTHEVGLL